MPLLSLVCGSLLLSAPAQADTITFSCPGATVEHALRQLGDATSLQLHASKDLQGLPLIVCVKDMKREALFDAIADCFAAKWSVSGSRWTLVPDTYKVKARTDEALKTIIETIVRHQANIYTEASAERMLNNTLDLLSKAAASSISQEQSSMLGAVSELPSGGLTRQFLQAVDPREIANLRLGQRVVFSTNPTRAQKPFTPAMRQVLATHRQRIDTFQRKLKEIGFSTGLIMEPTMRKYIEQSLAAQVPVSGGTFVLSYPSYRSVVSARFIDSEGRLANDTTMSYTPYASTESMRDRSRIQQQILAKLPADAKINPSERALRMMRAITPRTNSQQIVSGINSTRFTISLASYRQFSTEELTDWRQPDRFEPHGWFVGEAVQQFADLTDWDIVASPSDASLGIVAISLQRAQPTAASFMSALLSPSMNVIPDLLKVTDGTFVLRQDMTDTSFSSKAVDRGALAKILQTLTDIPIVTPSHCRSLGWISVYDSKDWQMWLQSGVPFPITFAQFHPSLSGLLQSLTDQQLAEIGSQGLPANGLTPPQQTALLNLMNAAESQPVYDKSSGRAREATEMFVNGFPSDARVKVQLRHIRTALAWKSEDQTGTRLSCGLFGSNPDILSDLEGYKSYLPFYSRGGIVSVEMGGWVWNFQGDNADSGPAGPAVDSWEKLPRDYTDAIRKIASGR